MDTIFTPAGYSPVFEFHVERNLRRKYQLDEAFFSTNGNVIFADFRQVRLFVHKINALRDPRLHIYPGEVNAAGMLEEIFHLVLRQYEKQQNPKAFTKATKHLEKILGADTFHQLILDIQEKFPATPVYKGELSNAAWLKGKTAGRANAFIALEEAIMLFFANFNPANKKIKELCDDKYLHDPNAFRLMIDHLEDFFEAQPGFGPNNQDLFSLFKTPILNAPDDISKQIDFILQNWKSFLPQDAITQLLKGKDLLREDVRFDTDADNADTPTMAPQYKGISADTQGFTLGKSGFNYLADTEKDYEEHDAFTTDVHWMPSVVMIAKNTYVWLDQLSKKYQREIRTLDQIPDQELDLLKNWNFTALWLIGIWERSEASKQIKHIMGNTDAVSSAYSLFDYQIAHDLGGETAYNNLNQRARERGIRLASDMVPNHTGIHSKWVIEHPEYFIQTEQPPFPGYTFNGQNLSQHPDFEIRIEDGYFNKSDAAVVFQRIDKKNNQTRYIYHGNDGTVMPWNDTAQLDMIKHEVREAVIQKIFEVAQKFSIIRFDAAMTLAKKHFSRLWYPRPGSGGDIPSRADYALTQKEFDTLFPVEFWREVVDRMNAQMPETLLLAEAFWFMEGYFVRTLGMHRVYNSAFMHMLKNEENEKYRDLITNTLEFEPEILKRYVNFMSNPDEETAIRQFGTDDKYFGVCVLMNTLPGLPMFAHGQIEGYTEKYGMEYQRAYYNEVPDNDLIEKHRQQIFPITHKRYLFSEVHNFNIFDYVDGYGNINENVFAFTNRHGNEKALVLYNNKYEQTQGRIHFSAPKLAQGSNGKEPQILSLAQALNIEEGENHFIIFREQFSGLEYIKKCNDFHHNGFHWNLNGFEYRLFWDFRHVYDSTGEYEKLYWKAGAGVPSVDRALREIKLQPLHLAFEALFAEDIINFLINRVMEENRGKSQRLGYTLLKGRFEDFVCKTADQFNLSQLNVSQCTEAFMARIKSIENAFDLFFQEIPQRQAFLAKYGISRFDQLLTIGTFAGYRENMIVLLATFVLRSFLENLQPNTREELSENLMLKWPLCNILKRTGRGDQAVARDISLIMLLTHTGHQMFDFSALNTDAHQTDKFLAHKKALIAAKAKEAATMLNEENIRSFIGVNEYDGIVYFSKESYEELINWLMTTASLDYFTLVDDEISLREKTKLELLLRQNTEFSFMAKEISGKAGYRLQNLIRLLENL